MSKTYMCELIKKVPLYELERMKELLIDYDVLDKMYSEMSIQEFILFLENRIDINADQDLYKIKQMEGSIARFYALKYLNEALLKLEKDTGYLPDLGDVLFDEVYSPAIDRFMTALDFQY